MALLIYTSGTTGAPKACCFKKLEWEMTWLRWLHVQLGGINTDRCVQGIVYDHSHLMHGVHFFGEQCALAALGRQLKTGHARRLIRRVEVPKETCIFFIENG